MTRENVLLFIGMAINAEKQARENETAIKEETGLSYAAVNLRSTPEVHVMVKDMKPICEAMGEHPAIKARDCDTYPFELSIVVEGSKVFAICERVPDWAESPEVGNE